jgi:hypothetical protein
MKASYCNSSTLLLYRVIDFADKHPNFTRAKRPHI